MNLRAELEKRLSAAMAAAGAEPGTPAMVSPSARAEFGDYQANGVMAAAKRLRTNPRQLAEKVRSQAVPALADLAESVEVAGPGFLNVRLRTDWLSGELTRRLADERLGVQAPPASQRVVVDYSAPNIAKEMHVGHLRSTIIGDALARVLDFLGHEVIRQNHVGDWGTQFGRVILGMWHISMACHRQDPGFIERNLKELSRTPPKADVDVRRGALGEIRRIQEEDLLGDRNGEKIFHPFITAITKRRSLSLGELQEAYRFVNLVETLAEGTALAVPASREEDPPQALESLSRYITGRFLQKKDEDRNWQEQEAWAYARTLTLDACDVLYGRLNVTLTRDHVRGESAYDDDLPNVVADLAAAGLLTESQGAQCVFLDEFKGKDDEPLPMIVRKSGEGDYMGGYLYATTDLAAIRYRVRELHADRILYVVGAPQSLHFRMLFKVAVKAGFAPESLLLEHVPFGTVMGDDGKPFRARAGEAVKLMDLLDEAEVRALALVSEKSPELPEAQRREIARVVGIAAVKYADLSQNRASDYVFSWDKMLSLEGNTAPYMQYAYARVQSIFRKGQLQGGQLAGQVALAAPAERALGLKLAQFPETVDAVARECLPNLLCGYLYDLAGLFMSFYESCPVLKADDPATRASRLLLCQLTARTIAKGLSLLGIQTVEQM
jgi:arginyl-tRNA synthetase